MDGFRGRERVDLDELPELYTILRGEVREFSLNAVL